MTRFSVGGDDDRNELGPSPSNDGDDNLGFPIKRRRLADGADDSHAKSEVDRSDEEPNKVQPSESTVQPIEAPPPDSLSSVETAESGSSSRTGSGSVQLTLTDPDVLDCPICFEPLSLPVYQCDNGHLGCASCCVRMNHRCGSCYLPIGYNRCRAIEKVLESIKIPCKNKKCGCTQLLNYREKLDHEKSCEFLLCKCPYPRCTYTGSSKSLYTHFPINHSSSCREFHFSSIISIKFDQFDRNLVFLQERTEKTLFVLSRFYGALETSFSLYLICISPDKKFTYDLTVRDEVSSIQLKTVVECTTDRSLHIRASKYLFVPDDFLNDWGPLKLELVIHNRQ